MSRRDLWDSLADPPASALNRIEAGRLKGMSDINPQWRYQALTEAFGPCGDGWKFEIVRLWTEPGSDGQVFAFAEIALYYRLDGEWSEPVPGVGGSLLVALESKGHHANDEAYKMAVTDALGTAAKMIGVAASVYLGQHDGRYSHGERAGPENQKPTAAPAQTRGQEQTSKGEAVACPKCGGPTWDNRGRKTNPRAPDFKCRDKGCDGVIWPPKQDSGPAPAPPLPTDELPFDPNDDGPF